MDAIGASIEVDHSKQDRNTKCDVSTSISEICGSTDSLFANMSWCDLLP